MTLDHALWGNDQQDLLLRNPVDDGGKCGHKRLAVDRLVLWRHHFDAIHRRAEGSEIEWAFVEAGGIALRKRNCNHDSASVAVQLVGKLLNELRIGLTQRWANVAIVQVHAVVATYLHHEQDVVEVLPAKLLRRQHSVDNLRISLRRRDHGIDRLRHVRGQYFDSS